MENVKERQYQFDFIKGIAIISVILLHAGISHKYFSTYWIGQAVPLFIGVSCFLGCLSLFKNDGIRTYFGKERIKRMVIRIFKPFILAQIVLVGMYSITNNFSIKGFLAGGGIGPGSYYPWVYIQLWVLIPFMFLLMRKNTVIGMIIIMLVSIITNVLFATLNAAEWFQIPLVNHKKEWFVLLYRLCINRYLFIFPLVFLLIEQKIKYSIVLFLGFIGAGCIYAMTYKDISIEPLVYTSGWEVYEYPSHCYTLLVLLYLYKIYEYIPKMVRNIVNKIGGNSWEIYNMQMIYFSFCGYLNINKYANVVLGLFVCIMPIYTYEFMKKPIEIKKMNKYGHST